MKYAAALPLHQQNTLQGAYTTTEADAILQLAQHGVQRPVQVVTPVRSHELFRAQLPTQRTRDAEAGLAQAGAIINVHHVVHECLDV